MFLGYDYYMYVGTTTNISHQLTEIEQEGLFVEKMISPYHNENGIEESLG